MLSFLLRTSTTYVEKRHLEEEAAPSCCPPSPSSARLLHVAAIQAVTSSCCRSCSGCLYCCRSACHFCPDGDLVKAPHWYYNAWYAAHAVITNFKFRLTRCCLYACYSVQTPGTEGDTDAVEGRVPLNLTIPPCSNGDIMSTALVVGSVSADTLAHSSLIKMNALRGHPYHPPHTIFPSSTTS